MRLAGRAGRPQVKAGCEAAFVAATLDNARHSRREPGIARFDVMRCRDDPARFSLIEVYRDSGAAAAHKATPHYARWRDAVEPMMAAPRVGTWHEVVDPLEEASWTSGSSLEAE